MNRDVTIIGAGIVGLATGYQLLRSHPHLKVTILEKEEEVARHQTGNNSGVIHSGVYYKPGSLKAKNCTAGKSELLEFCQKFNIATQKLGKVIVATEKSQIAKLDEIENRGRANGVAMERVGPSRLKEIEPHVVAIDALWIPDCSIISYKEVAKQLSAEFQRLGGEVCLNEAVIAIDAQSDSIRINTPKNEYTTKQLINCAGLFSDRIAREAMGKKQAPQKILPFRGEYYELTKEKNHLVKGLIYPVPDPRFPFLGVHLTRMINGKVEAGPNAILALAREGYRKVDFSLKDCMDVISYPGFWKMASKYWRAGFYEMARSFSKRLFLRDLQKLIPEIQEKDLSPGGAGIRAQVVTRDGKLVDDFSILEEKNMVHVLNAPSPAATASFAIGRQIAERVIF
ncbi:MAG: L-2-hydroxyglutarate oxidase [Chlamydiae bacterium CG10_big_fil_rev_8_21_14_0_10_42_34]|nr:MAG: L-2-hydroxyglutarate oxidase [Chlamydiae bacterium CG10_big_fil_rev_8_21_14_0_10_42_34]